jgi:hypothetical protein
MLETIEYITWLNSPNWQSNIILGDQRRRYDFLANWNIRDNSWYISIKLGDEELITNIAMRLNVNLLDFVYSANKPNCALYPRSDNANIDRITFDNMISGVVKLYHILPGNIS